MVRAASPCPVTRRSCSEATVGPSRCEQPRFGESTQEIRDAWGALRRSRRHRAGTDAMDPPAGDPSLLSSCRGARGTGVQIHSQKCRFRARGPAMAEALQRAEQPSGAVGAGAACVRLQAEDECLQAAQAAGVGAAGAPGAAPASVRAGDPDARARPCGRLPIRIASRRTGRRSVPTPKRQELFSLFRNGTWARDSPPHFPKLRERPRDPLPPFECWLEIESLEDVRSRKTDRFVSR